MSIRLLFKCQSRGLWLIQCSCNAPSSTSLRLCSAEQMCVFWSSFCARLRLVKKLSAVTFLSDTFMLGLLVGWRPTFSLILFSVLTFLSSGEHLQAIGIDVIKHPELNSQLARLNWNMLLSIFWLPRLILMTHWSSAFSCHNRMTVNVG